MIARHHHGTNDERGFTLVELLVATTLLGLIMMALFGGLRFGTAVWQAGEARADRISELQAVQGFLERQIERTQPVRRSGQAGRRELLFDGLSDSLSFVSLMPEHLGIAGYYLFELHAPTDLDSGRLVMRRQLVQPGASEVESVGEPEERVLIDGVSRLEIAYFGAMRPQDAPVWQDRWVDATTLPWLVRIRVVFEEDDRRTWPELVVAPRVEPTSVLR